MKLDNFKAFNWGLTALASLVVLVYFECVKMLTFIVIFKSQLIKLFLVVTYGGQKLCISLLSSQEFRYHLLNIRVTCGCSDLLERLLEIVILFHFVFHLFLEELAPQLLDTKVGSELYLILIFVFISSCFGNFWLSFNSIHSLLESLFLVLNTEFKGKNSLLALFDLMLNVLH